MKELSIEEKAKRYDEAIKRAKEINDEQRAQPHNVMTRVFPELAESKDEKIRKYIIKVVHEWWVRCNDPAPDFPNEEQMLAWLEKKGEQKPADIPEDFEKYVEHLLSFSDGEGHGSPAKVKEVSSELLKLANQQKTTWSEEDEKNFARVDYACLKVYGGDSYSSDWLRKFLGIHKKWKPSDVQMVVLNDIIINGHLSNANERILKGLQEQLKKLREE